MGLGLTSLLALAAFLLTTVLTIFTLFFAVAFTIQKTNWYFQVGIAAAALDVLDLACIALWFLLNPYRPHTRSRVIQLVALLFAFITSHALSLVLFIWMQIHPAKISTSPFGVGTMPLLVVAWILWGASLLGQTLFIVLWTFQRPQRAIEEPLVSRYILGRISESWAPPSSASLHFTASPYFAQLNAFSRATSSYSTDNGVHSKLSNTTSIWPVTSRTRLALSPSVSGTEVSTLASATEADSTPTEINASIDYGSSPMASPSSVSELIPLTTRPTTPTKQRLEPIPGSQPNSPGKPLEGPFDQPHGLESERKLDKGIVSSPQEEMSPERDRGRAPSRIPPRFRKDGVLLQSQPSSPVLDESHIHPLFRTYNPLPAPTPTVGSTIIASAFGGQYMSSRSVSRAGARSGQTSGQNSPTKLQAISGNRRRAGSHGALADNANYADAIKRTKSMGAVKSEPKMTRREEDENTPPIPSDGYIQASGEVEKGSLDDMENRTGIAI